MRLTPMGQPAAVQFHS